MQAYLMFKDKNMPHSTSSVLFEEDILSDLELETILSSMSGKDKVIYEVCKNALLSPLSQQEDITYRQQAVKDAFNNSEDIKALYKLCSDAEEKRNKSWYRLSTGYMPGTLSNAIALLNMYLSFLTQLRDKSEECSHRFKSEAFSSLFSRLSKELSNDFFTDVRNTLNELDRRDGILISAVPGSFLQGVNYTLREKEDSFILKWLTAKSYTLGGKDEIGDTDFAKRKERALNEVTNALAQSAEHVISFFNLLRYELAFYAGCINLRGKLQSYGMYCCIPDVLEAKRSWDGLFDLSLCLTKGMRVVGESLEGRADVNLFIITGANQGGKSTFLRSMGQAQLMGQCGMPVGANSFSFPIREAVYTHFKREEDSSIKSGKLDEELQRLDMIISSMKKNCMIMFNESFAATNEREGSEISKQITSALIESGVEIFSVTHLYSFAKAYIGNKKTCFLRAERSTDGERTYRIHEAEPLKTAFGEDLYKKIFGQE